MLESAVPRTARRLLAGTAATALTIGGVLVTAPPAAALDGVVDNVLDNGTPGTLRYEIENSNPGDTITFNPAVFDTAQTILLESQIDVPHDITITGPGSDLLTVQRNDAITSHPLFFLSGLVSGETDVDVTITGMTLDDAPADTPLQLRHAIYSDASSALGDVTLSDLVVRDQDVDALGGGGGAVILIGADAVSISDSVFENNTSAWSGGALLVMGAASVTLTGSEFRHNTAFNGDGGAIAIANSGAVTVTDSVMYGNAAQDGPEPPDAGNGGAMFVWGGGTSGSLTVTGSSFGGPGFEDVNTAARDGGHIAAAALTGDVAITDSRFEQGSAGDGGAGVYVGEIDAFHLTDSTFSSHESGGSGGALWLSDFAEDSTVTRSSFQFGNSPNGAGIGAEVDGANLTITDSTFQENSLIPAGDAYGAGLYLMSVEAGAVTTVQGSTFSGHRVDGVGGDAYGSSIGVESLDGELRVVNSTLDEHDDAAAQFAVYVAGAAEGALARIAHSTISSGNGAIGAGSLEGAIEIDHTILADEGDGEIVDRGSDGFTGPITSAWSILTDAAPDVTLLAGNQVGVDPQLGPLQNNGGPTFTRVPAASSPAVNHGNPVVSGAPATDQRGAGFDRIVQTIDIGAVEQQADLLPATGAAVPPWTPIAALMALLLGAVALAGGKLRPRSRG